MTDRTRVLILGAGGRDFHVFNTCYRDNPSVEVVAFTATQIPGIDSRIYPAVLAGPHYPEGVPILPEADLETLVRERRVEDAVFAYSDVSFDYVENMKARVEETGATFSLFDPDRTMIRGKKPCVAVCAVRTGCGKSALSRYVAALLREMGKRPGILRHPMPYGNLHEQVVQRFAEIEDLAHHRCTIEEMEEYEPHIKAGNVVFAGTDYAKILDAAEEESDVIIWDGGNNDTPFIRPDLWITVLDPLRPGHELTYFPGRWNFERADVLVIGKTGEAREEDLALLRRNIEEHSPNATVVLGRSPFEASDPEAIRGKRALVVEDGPTTTHGGMGYGAGYLAAERAGAAEIVDPRPFAAGDIAAAFRDFPHLKSVLPALGYGEKEIADLQATIEAADCDVVVIGTPIDLTRVVEIDKPTVRVTYGFEEVTKPGLAEIMKDNLG
ncbi:MAG: cyclic 2,3-diphosphoglycerate synthase [Planctomycetota bacterium]|jgi:predicted GTPase